MLRTEKRNFLLYDIATHPVVRAPLLHSTFPLYSPSPSPSIPVLPSLHSPSLSPSILLPCALSTIPCIAIPAGDADGGGVLGLLDSMRMQMVLPSIAVPGPREDAIVPTPALLPAPGGIFPREEGRRGAADGAGDGGARGFEGSEVAGWCGYAGRFGVAGGDRVSCCSLPCPCAHWARQRAASSASTGQPLEVPDEAREQS
ncbi:hypothetical protein FB451DRAFT_1307787 [Mycena latifolia]|nr:hypothetical protein FB451DRAFT_1307787 [Mycena latifolia]